MRAVIRKNFGEQQYDAVSGLSGDHQPVAKPRHGKNKTVHIGLSVCLKVGKAKEQLRDDQKTESGHQRKEKEIGGKQGKRTDHPAAFRLSEDPVFKKRKKGMKQIGQHQPHGHGGEDPQKTRHRGKDLAEIGQHQDGNNAAAQKERDACRRREAAFSFVFFWKNSRGHGFTSLLKRKTGVTGRMFCRNRCGLRRFLPEPERECCFPVGFRLKGHGHAAGLFRHRVSGRLRRRAACR